MNNNDSYRREQKLLIVIFSDANFLALNILEILLSKNCLVTIVSDDKSSWKNRTRHISAINRFSIIGEDQYKNLSNFSYAIFCGGFLKKDSAIIEFKKFISNNNFGSAKTLAVFPFETFSLKSSSKINICDNAGIIYLGDTMGPRIDLQSDLLLPSLINEMVIERTVTLGIGEVFYPVFITDVAKTLVKWLLSFGPYGKDTFLLGQQVSSSDFWKQNLKSFPDLKVVYDTNIESRFIPKGYDTHYINSNLNICLNETYKWFLQEKLTPAKLKIENKIVKRPKPKKPSKLRFLRPYLLPFFLITFFPIITTLISSGFLYISYRQFLLENIKNAQNMALVAKTIFVIGKGESDMLSYVPLVGKIYKETSYISFAGETLSDLAVNSYPLAENGREVLDGVLGTGIYDVNLPSQKIRSVLDYLYQQISLFDAATQENANNGELVAKQVNQLVDFDKLKSLSLETGILMSKLPSILGKDSNKNYLVLFQNNMELRPTGGFIGSYGVVNFGGGKMNGLNINDIYSADGQLKGHIEPPSPIKNYLGEANWFFRDSNWDPDFPTSAERAEWFLNKEMDQEVDGVVAVDLTPIKNILRYTGPIFLPDYNLTINSDNLYERTQEEAQANFFPGSRKKASFLTALSRSLLSEITKMNSKNRILVLRALYESLVARNIQVYLHDQDAAGALDKLGWDGKIQSYSCGDTCYSDFFGDVEANVGVNKSNYFIKRSMDFGVNVSEENVSRRLGINLVNIANPSLGPSGIYKTYMRIIVPSDSEISSVKSVVGSAESVLKPDIVQEKGRKEVGVLVEINPLQSKQVIFEWSTNISSHPKIYSYGLYVRNQAGAGDGQMSIKFAGQGSIVARPAFNLTNGGNYSYNTNLTKDFFVRISWK